MRSVILCVAVTFLAACGGSGDTSDGDGTPGLATVVRVVDGDTVVLSFDGRDERVRLIGIDTPESVDPNRPVECLGPEASAFTKSLLPDGTKVIVERDVEARDDYGRLLGYITRLDDGMFVNLEIVRRGFAQPLTIPPNVAYSKDFVAAASHARDDNLGLWALCAG